MKLPSNRERADWASRALDAFAAECNMTDEDREYQISDLLCDLMHFCDIEDINFSACIGRAEDHHREEKQADYTPRNKVANQYYSLNVNKTTYTCLSIEEAEDMQSRLGGSISHQFTNE